VVVAPRSKVRARIGLPLREPLIVGDFVLAVAVATLSPSLLRALFAVVAFRLGLVLNSLLNEWGHVLVGVWRGAGRRALNAPNLLGRRPLSAHVVALLPFAPDGRGDLSVRIDGLSPVSSRIVRRGGFFVGAALSLATLIGVAAAVRSEQSVLPIAIGYALGTALALVGAVVSDLTQRTHYAALANIMACGNVTLMGRLFAEERAAFPKRSQTLIRSMLSISQMRGAQSGGGAIQVRRGKEPRQLIQKCVNTKRGDLAERMTGALIKKAGSHPAFGGSFIVQAHVRYATAGLTTKHEAHPFRFVEAAARGPRRVMTFSAGSWQTESRPIETALTHNGDMDGLRWRGTSIGFPDLSAFLERVLGVPNRWVGDSPLLAAAIELFLTRGLWLESLRLAYHLVAAPAPPDFASIPAELQGPKREHALRALAQCYPSPTLRTLGRWEGLAEQALLEESDAALSAALLDPSEMRRYRDRIADQLSARIGDGGEGEIPPERSLAFARAAVNAFFDNDLYIALRKLEPALDGTFGCVVSSTLEPGCVVALSRGQPLSLGFQRSSGTVCIVSERAAIKVRAARDTAAFDERLDLDLCRGEIARVALSEERSVHLTLYGISDGREYNPDELAVAGRLVPLGNNPYISALPVQAKDRVDADIQAVVPILQRVRAEFQSAGSHNARTAGAFAEALFKRPRPRLLLLGITNDLWLSQQFARNLRALFPRIDVQARSSNEVLREETAIEFDENTVVLAVSQSGQDFPTLGAFLLLQQRAGAAAVDAFFVLTGEIDSLMGQAVGQCYALGAEFSARIFANCSGFRPSEAAIATVNATWYTLLELLLDLARRAQRMTTPAHGFALDPSELAALRSRCDLSVDRHAGLITAKVGAKSADAVSRQLKRQARRWTWHVLEGIVAFAVVVLVLELNLQLRLGLLPSHLLAALPRTAGRWTVWASSARNLIGGQADVAFYAFLAPLTVWGLRKIQRRPTFHRHGTRELLIGDTAYVHQIVWLLARKLFSLSYGFASIKPYSADCQDDLIMTHEPVRGTLLLVGVPDARRQHLHARGAAAFMTAKQFNNSRSFAGAGAEIVTIGHAPPGPGTPFGVHLALPSGDVLRASLKVDLLVEDMFDSWERMLGMQVFLDRVARGVASLALFSYDRSRTKDQVFAPTTAAPVSAAAIYQLLSRTTERYERFEHSSLPFEVVRSEWRATAPARRTTLWRSDAATNGAVPTSGAPSAEPPTRSEQ
jgi:hypothetical protein